MENSVVNYQLSLSETGADHQTDMERYRSGHNEAVLKTVCPKGRVGSNPTLSVLKRFRHFGEVPKWLKGLPWKGSRSLVAARGFKSLLLRWMLNRLKKPQKRY